MALFRNRKRRTEVLERPEYGWIWKPLLTLVVLYLVVCIGLGIWWSQRPDGFDVEQATAERRGQAATTPAARGAVTTATLMTAIDTLLDKPGGYLRNDVAPPGLWLDNVPSWEYGVLSQARLLTQALAAMNPGEAAMLGDAEEALDTDSRDWLYPSAEKRYARAVEALGGYLASLSAESATGFAGSGDALAQWLHAVGQRFGDLTHRLSASIDDPQALRELGVDEAELPDATPWHHIDNVFFEARGDAWAFMHFLRAIKRDYADVLAEAEATATMDRLIAELEMAQRRLWSPLVLNGSGFGIFANHPLVLANYTTGVRELTRDLAASVSGVEVKTPAPSTSQPAGAESAGAQQTQGSAQSQDASQAGQGEGVGQDEGAAAEEGGSGTGGASGSSTADADKSASQAQGSDDDEGMTAPEPTAEASAPEDAAQ